MISNEKIAIVDSDKMIKSDKETANVLNEFFSNIVTNFNIPQFDQIDLTSEKISESVIKAIVKCRARRSHRRCSVKKGVLKNFAKFTRKHLRQSLLFNKVAGLRSATLFKKRLWRRCFPMNFPKFLRTREVHVQPLASETRIYAFFRLF